jgi:glycosyltransferase involved in cell wall biosynthesis
VFISPATYRIMADESKAFPFWGEYKSRENIDLAMKLWRETAETADLLLCPSDWVADGVRETTPEAADKVRVVPYGCSIDYHGRTNHPVRGRVLFAGGSPLRKGLHYLAQAATRLKPIIPDLNVRIAGHLPREVVEDPVCRDLCFLGKLTSDQMKDEYLAADLFVLPSLSEGFAGVVAEAVGAGCPVVVTREAGSPVVNEREGLVVPSRDADSLAQAIRRIVEDRTLRDALAAESRRQAGFYSEQAWLQRLVKAVEQLQQGFHPLEDGP